MVVSLRGLIKDRENRINCLGKRYGRVDVAEKNSRPLVIEVVANKAKLAFGQNGLRMRTSHRFTFPILQGSSSAEVSLEDNVLFFRCMLFAGITRLQRRGPNR